MKKIVCVMVLCVSYVYSSEPEITIREQDNIDSIKALGIGYCLGYDVEKLYDEGVTPILLGFDDNERNNIINEIKAVIDTINKEFLKYEANAKKELSKFKKDLKYETSTKNVRHSAETRLFYDCFIIYKSYTYEKEVERIVKKYCKDCK